MVPYVCQNVYVVCFFRADSFPCFLSNEPRSPRGSEPKPHAIYTDRTAGALPAKAVRDEEVGGWVEKLSWKLQVKPSVGCVSLFPFFCFTLSSSSPSFSFSPGCPERPGQVKLSSGHLHCLTNITHSFESCFTSPSSHFFIALLIFNSLCSWCFFLFLSDTRFLSHFQLKSLLFWTEYKKVDFPSNCASTHFVLLLRRTKPACCYKTELFVFFSFSSALQLRWCLSYCEPRSCEVVSSPLFPSLMWARLHFSSLIISSFNRSVLSAQRFLVQAP